MSGLLPDNPNPLAARAERELRTRSIRASNADRYEESAVCVYVQPTALFAKTNTMDEKNRECAGTCRIRPVNEYCGDPRCSCAGAPA